ncbi:MAG: TrkA family potassium uptake protein [Anaerolineae bacterium]|nr:TrkA family potassium uptake protein [Anaerolineae bacterium]
MPQSQLILPRGEPPRRLLRYVRASWHDTRALTREFRRPLLAIFLSIFVGGWIYGRLTVLAGYESIALVDLPYIMLALMIIENPLDYVPEQWYLIVFFYIQPAVGVYIIGQGAVDFIRLFFNRSERRSAWELAVARTYRNHVIVIGVGHVGLRVIRTLVLMGFEVVAVDNELDSESDIELRKLDVPVLAGDGRLSDTLMDAGIAFAQSVVVCTANDHINLELTMRARDLNPDVRIVSRMWDARFSDQLQRFLNVQVMSASDLAAPAFAGTAVGIEITQTLQVGNFEFSMIRLAVQKGSFMEGQTIDVLQEDEDIDIVLHGENGHDPVVHPDGDIMVGAGDTLVLFARHDKITEIVARNQRV